MDYCPCLVTDPCTKALYLLIRKSALIFAIALLASPAFTQTTLKINRPPETAVNLLQLSEVFGAVHYLNVACNGRSKQEWRSHMVELLELENPDYQLRSRLIAAFNQGYRDHELQYPVCSPAIARQIQSIAKKGRILSDALADPYLK